MIALVTITSHTVVTAITVPPRTPAPIAADRPRRPVSVTLSTSDSDRVVGAPLVVLTVRAFRPRK